MQMLAFIIPASPPRVGWFVCFEIYPLKRGRFVTLLQVPFGPVWKWKFRDLGRSQAKFGLYLQPEIVGGGVLASLCLSPNPKTKDKKGD